MKPPRFEYVDPSTLTEALRFLAEHRDEAKPLAGGQSLVPLLNYRLARPKYLLDLNRIPTLGYISEDGSGVLEIGAMARHREVESSSTVRARCPLLSEATRLIGHAAIRNRGTFGGSLAHADPAAELPVAVTALGGEVVLQSARQRRVLSVKNFVRSYLTTALEPDELLVAVRVPALPPRAGCGFLEISRRRGDFALVCAAATITLDVDGVCSAASVVLGGVGPAPVRVESVELLVGARPSEKAFQEVASAAKTTVEPESDVHATSEYRRHVSAVLAQRVLAVAYDRALRRANE